MGNKRGSNALVKVCTSVMNPLILSVMGLIVSLLSFYKDGFSIKYPTTIDMPLKKETKPGMNKNTHMLKHDDFLKKKMNTKNQ